MWQKEEIIYAFIAKGFSNYSSEQMAGGIRHIEGLCDHFSSFFLVLQPNGTSVFPVTWVKDFLFERTYYHKQQYCLEGGTEYARCAGAAQQRGRTSIPQAVF